MHTNVKFINCTPTNADGYPYLVDFSSKGSGTGYLTENEVNSKLQNYYTKTECDNKYALKGEGGGETINWSNINEDSISMTARNRMSIRSDGDFELYCDGTFTLTSPNEIHTVHYLYCDPADSLYATEKYVNTKIGEIKLSDLTAYVLDNFDMQCTGRIGIDTSNEISLTAESNVTITAYKDLLLKTRDGSVKIEGSKLYDVNTESYYTTTKDIETQLEN